MLPLMVLYVMPSISRPLDKLRLCILFVFFLCVWFLFCFYYFQIQRINVLLKDIKKRYNLKTVKNISSHSLRKTFGRHIYERADSNGEVALAMLSELFNHSNIAITKRYLGLRKEEIMQCYDLLDF